MKNVLTVGKTISWKRKKGFTNAQNDISVSINTRELCSQLFISFESSECWITFSKAKDFFVLSIFSKFTSFLRQPNNRAPRIQFQWVQHFTKQQRFKTQTIVWWDKFSWITKDQIRCKAKGGSKNFRTSPPLFNGGCQKKKPFHKPTTSPTPSSNFNIDRSKCTFVEEGALEIPHPLFSQNVSMVVNISTRGCVSSFVCMSVSVCEQRGEF